MQCDFEDAEKAIGRMQEQFKAAAPRLSKCIESLAGVVAAGQVPCPSWPAAACSANSPTVVGL